MKRELSSLSASYLFVGNISTMPLTSITFISWVFREGRTFSILFP